MLSTAIHHLNFAAQWPGHRRFVRALHHVEATQRTVLARLLFRAAHTEFGRAHGLGPHLRYEEVAARLSVTEWADWESLVATQRQHPHRRVLTGPCSRYEPTSGSTAARKWIPYPPAFRAQLDAAVAPWLFDLLRRQPGARRGRHYWSLSWLPAGLRAARAGEAAASNDDLELLPAWKRLLMGRVMAVGPEVARLPTPEASLQATLETLAATADLSLISVWSPTFLLSLLRALARTRDSVAAKLAPAAPARARLLADWDGELSPEFLHRLWGRLAVISAWDTASARPFADEVRRLFPRAAFQGKGVWATEGVVTIPYRGVYPLAVTSHFFEFRDLATDSIIPAWKLAEGQEVQPLLSTAGGLWRYALTDRLRVDGRLGEAPCLTFLGRLAGVDLVGEKLDSPLAQRVLEQVSDETGLCCISLLGTTSPEPHYLLLAQGPAERAGHAATRAEALLCEVHHYALARELGQLGPVEPVVRDDIVAWYEAHTGGTAAAGARKIEAVGYVRSGPA